MHNPDGTFGKHPILVIAPGDSCWLDSVEAKVVQVCVRPGNSGEYGVQYQVSWWDGNNRKCEWVEEFETKPISPNGPFLQIGFSAGRN